MNYNEVQDGWSQKIIFNEKLFSINITNEKQMIKIEEKIEHSSIIDKTPFGPLIEC